MASSGVEGPMRAAGGWLMVWGLAACTGGAPTDDPADPQAEAPPAAPVTPAAPSKLGVPLSQRAGAYTAGGHDDAWICSVKPIKQGLGAGCAYLPTMLPPPDAVSPTYEDLVMVMLDDRDRYSTRVGAVHFDGDGPGGRMVFDDVDNVGEALTLTRDPTWDAAVKVDHVPAASPADLVGSYVSQADDSWARWVLSINEAGELEAARSAGEGELPVARGAETVGTITLAPLSGRFTVGDDTGAVVHREDGHTIEVQLGGSDETTTLRRLTQPPVAGK